MKKTVILATLMALAAASASAEQKSVFMEFHRKSNPGTQTKINRSPMKMPVNVDYDTETGLLSVSADESLDGCVYLYDSLGTVIYQSAYLDAEIFVTDGSYSLIIDGDGWYAEGAFEI